MADSGRDEIIARLKAAPKCGTPARQPLPPFPEASLDRGALVERFTETFAAETGIVYRAKDKAETLERLTRIVREEGLRTVMISNDDVVAALDLPAWGNDVPVEVLAPGDFREREDFKDAVFDRADAGITGVGFAIAESGTLGLMHDKDQPRLTSLAPILHIAVVPVDRILPVYEPAVERVFADRKRFPSQFVFITGPSMTGDIQGLLFKGMHGPRKVIVILVG